MYSPDLQPSGWRMGGNCVYTAKLARHPGGKRLCSDPPSDPPILWLKSPQQVVPEAGVEACCYSGPLDSVGVYLSHQVALHSHLASPPQGPEVHPWYVPKPCSFFVDWNTISGIYSNPATSTLASICYIGAAYFLPLTTPGAEVSSTQMTIPTPRREPEALPGDAHTHECCIWQAVSLASATLCRALCAKGQRKEGQGRLGLPCVAQQTGLSEDLCSFLGARQARLFLTFGISLTPQHIPVR